MQNAGSELYFGDVGCILSLAWECFKQIDFYNVYDIIKTMKAAGSIKFETLFRSCLINPVYVPVEWVSERL